MMGEPRVIKGDRSHMTDRIARPNDLTRRGMLRAGAAIIGGGGLLTACSSGIKGSGPSTSTSGTTSGTSAASAGTITIGWIHPLTGPLAGFGAADQFVLSKIQQ